jgi:hypothetical protein
MQTQGSSTYKPATGTAKSMITHLIHNGVPIVDENLKAEAIFDHFDQIMGSVVERTDGVNLDCIGLPCG